MSNNASQSPVDWSLLAESLARSLTHGTKDDAGAVSTEVAAVCAAAFASGFTRGRWGKVEIGGVPFDLGAGVLLHLLSWSGVAREQSRELQNLAEGALATYFATWGATVGKRVRQGEQVLPELGSLVRALEKGAEGRLNDASPGTNGSLPAKDGELLDFIRTIVPN